MKHYTLIIIDELHLDLLTTIHGNMYTLIMIDELHLDLLTTIHGNITH